MTANVVWHGVAEWEHAVTSLTVKANASTREAVVTAAHLVQAAMQKRAGEGGRHAKDTPTPAVQGSGPAVISGTLRRSIHVGDVKPLGPLGWEAKVGPGAIYGRRIELEYNYPYASPGLEDVKGTVAAVFYRAWSAALH